MSGSQPDTTQADPRDAAPPGSSTAPVSLTGDVRALPDPARLLMLAALAVVGGLLTTVPLALTVFGGVELLALLQNRWDPTWNDGDVGIAAAGVVALLVLLGAATAAGSTIGRIGRFSRRAVVVAAALGTFLVASGVYAACSALRA